MSYFPLLTEEKAGPELKSLYGQVRLNYGFVPNYFQALGHTPAVIAPHLAFGGQILQDAALPKTVKEQIGLVVSGINSSSYCVAIHMEILHRLGIEKALGRKLAVDYANAPVEPNVKALFRYADRLTRKPMEIERTDIEALRQAGWSDAAIVEATLAVAFFNFVNRFSLGLGLVADF